MVILLNCSYRGEKSNSNYFLGLLENQITVECERIHLKDVKNFDLLIDKLSTADALVLGMPLYVDGAPAQVVELMEYLYDVGKNHLERLKVYVLSNLGFYESHQINIQLQIVINWCSKMGLVYGGGLAIGAGGMLGGLRNIPYNQGPNHMMGMGINSLATSINANEVMEDRYVKPSGFPRFLYLFFANKSWLPQAKKNGIKRSEIKMRRG